MNFKKKHLFLEDVCNFLNCLSIEMSFLKSNLIEIVSSFKSNCKTDFKLCLGQYEMFLLKSTIDEKSFQTNYKKLDQEIMLKLNNFLSDLGSTDIANQLEMIKNYKNYFENKKNEYEKKYNKYGNLIFKLFILFGLVIVILFF